MRHVLLGLVCAVCVLPSVSLAGTTTGRILHLEGTPLLEEIQGFQLIAFLNGTDRDVGVGELIDSRKAKGFYEYKIELNDDAIKRISQAAKGRVDVRIRLEFTASNRDPATVTGVAATGTNSIDIVMPEKTSKCFGRRHRCRLLHRCR